MSKMAELHAELQEIAEMLKIEGPATLDDLKDLCAVHLARTGCGCVDHTQGCIFNVVEFAVEEYGCDQPELIEAELWMNMLDEAGLRNRVTFH